LPRTELPEELPIVDTNLLQYHIPPYGMFRFVKAIGNVTTSNYIYSVSIDGKFSFLDSAHQLSDHLKWSKEYSWPISQLDTNAAYQLATQWLAAVSMDVEALNRDCNLQIRPVMVTGEEQPPGLFLGILFPGERTGRKGSEAWVELFLPTKKLEILHVMNSKYILRKPLQFTNLDLLLSQTNAPAETNVPAKQ